LEQVIDAVAALLMKASNATLLNSVLGKALITWYATRSGAATLDEMGLWFDCVPTTLRADIESHRKMSPALFRKSVEELLLSSRCNEEATVSKHAASPKTAN
jgi:hypothetical protein